VIAQLTHYFTHYSPALLTQCSPLSFLQVEEQITNESYYFSALCRPPIGDADGSEILAVSKQG
jgi:hypothetical protein